MLKRRTALTLASLTALATLPVLSGTSPAGASATRPQVPFSRGGPGDGHGDPKGPKDEPPKDNCPTELWTVPLEIKGLACILLMPKPEQPGDGSGQSGGGGGLGGLLGS